jgi:hypothetical protein
MTSFEQPSRGVLVVGMARSGTSALTGMLSRLGLALAQDDDVIPGNTLNPLGVFESRTVRRFDQVLLARWCSGGWGDPRLPARWEYQRGIRMLHAPARRLFRSAHPSTAWVCKDPQFCLTLPFWLQTLSPVPSVALIYRHPLAVARSLQRGMGWDLARGVAIWERHQRSALRALNGQAVALVSYDDLVSDPVALAASVAQWLRAQGYSVAADAESAAASWIGVGERHWRAESEDASLLSPEQRELVGVLDRHRGTYDRWSPPVLPGETPTTTAMFGAPPLSVLLRRPRWWWWMSELMMPPSLSRHASRLRAPRQLREFGRIELGK